MNLGPIFGLMCLENALGQIQVLCCTNKEKNVLSVSLDDGKTTIIDTGNRTVVEFGCGIGPLMQISENDHRILTLSQSLNNKYVFVWKTNL